MSDAAHRGIRVVASGKATDIYGETFDDRIRQWLSDAPWLLISVLLHLVAGLVIANIEWQTISTDRNHIIQSHYENQEMEPLPEEEVDDEKVKKVEEIDEINEDPTVSDEVIYEEILEEECDEPIDSPFEGKNINDIIGVGGGAGSRFGGKYRKRSAPKQGNQATERAVDWGLDWLKRHQDPEGFWDCDDFAVQCVENPCSGAGQALNDPGVTGLALLAFLGSGNTPLQGRYKHEVRIGVRYLCSIQDPEDGCLAPKVSQHYMYNHAIACLALTEAYGLSHWVPLKKHVKQALDYIHATKNPGSAWRYNDGARDPVEQNDVSVTGWMIMCLASARDFGLPYHRQDLEEALTYIEEMTDPTTGRTGYKVKGSYSSREIGDDKIWPADCVETMTAVGMLSRVFCGNILGVIEEQETALQKGAGLLIDKPPQWDEEAGSIDFYYWYYGSYAMYQAGGHYWRTWRDRMVEAIVGHQCTEGCAKGSWDPQVGPWGDGGGRIYSTALCTLCLEVFYRYDKILGAR